VHAWGEVGRGACGSGGGTSSSFHRNVTEVHVAAGRLRKEQLVACILYAPYAVMDAELCLDERMRVQSYSVSVEQTCLHTRGNGAMVSCIAQALTALFCPRCWNARGQSIGPFGHEDLTWSIPLATPAMQPFFPNNNAALLFFAIVQTPCKSTTYMKHMG
jgi:hypothetical protein